MDRWTSTASPYLIRKLQGFPKVKIENENKTGKYAQWERRADRWRKKQKKKKNKKPKYAQYILSKAWRRRRIQFYNKFGRLCAACGSTKGLHIHHMSYKNLGSELDEDLVVLCGNCHKGLHSLYGVRGDMKVETAEFIEEFKKLTI